MIIAHLPAGYLLTKTLSAKFDAARARGLWIWGLLASVFPDIDILYFHLIDGAARNHRYYPTHWPLFWLGLFVVAAAVLLMARRRDLLAYPTVFLAGVGLHLLLDCLAGPVFYAAPFSWDRIQLIRVPSVYGWWVWNFIRHWTFQLELMTWALAFLVHGLSAWERGRKKSVYFKPWKDLSGANLL